MLFTFKQFSISYVEFLARLPMKQRLLALGILAFAAGLEGLPFAEDIEDIIDTVGQKMGYATNMKRMLRANLTDVMGDGIADFALHGFSTIPGMPIDVAARLGVSNLVPGTRLFNPSVTDKAPEVLEVFGAAGSEAKALVDLVTNDNFEGMLPAAFKGVYKAAQMADTGSYLDAKGRKVVETGPTDVVAKALGFQPPVVAESSREMTEAMRDIELMKHVKAGFADQLARAAIDGDSAARARIRAEIAQWNQRQPDYPVRNLDTAVMERVRAMRRTREERVLRTAPKELRGRLNAELNG